MYNAILGCLARMKEPDEKKMVELYEELKEKNMQPNLETYEAFILGLSKTSIQLITALLLPVVPSTSTRSTSFPLCYKRLIETRPKKDIKQARQRYHQMVREGFTPAPNTIHTLIKGYADAGATGDCVEFFHVLRRAGVAIPARDVHSILTVMLGLSEHQQATHLLEFFARENTWLDLESCSIL